MNANITREQAMELLKKYNKDSFHIQHGITVEGCMNYMARTLGYAEDAEFWGICGLLHEIDFECWPDDDCSEELIHAVCSHGYGLCCDVEPVHEMEKVLFAMDELTGLIGAAVILRPSHSCKDMDVKSLKKKFKDKRFAAGCSRDVISQGAERLGWELTDLFQYALDAMADCEDSINEQMAAL